MRGSRASLRGKLRHPAPGPETAWRLDVFIRHAGRNVIWQRWVQFVGRGCGFFKPARNGTEDAHPHPYAPAGRGIHGEVYGFILGFRV